LRLWSRGPRAGRVAKALPYSEFGSRCKAGRGIMAGRGGTTMHIAAAPTVSLIFAAALGLLNFWLSLRVARVRMSRKIQIGHGDLPEMEARMRAHANFNEYVPLALILMLLIELNVGPSRGLWVVGAILVVARVLHPFGMDRPAPNTYRASGAMLTWVALLALVIWAILLAYGVRF
jgi:uncharacterized membrane protein YecN with MAPEG domain